MLIMSKLNFNQRKMFLLKNVNKRYIKKRLKFMLRGNPFMLIGLLKITKMWAFMFKNMFEKSLVRLQRISFKEM